MAATFYRRKIIEMKKKSKTAIRVMTYEKKSKTFATKALKHAQT